LCGGADQLETRCAENVVDRPPEQCGCGLAEHRFDIAAGLYDAQIRVVEREENTVWLNRT
jgi:hypothetical protein